jgi:hypothetical protein
MRMSRSLNVVFRIMIFLIESDVLFSIANEHECHENDRPLSTWRTVLVYLK